MPERAFVESAFPVHQVRTRSVMAFSVPHEGFDRCPRDREHAEEKSALSSCLKKQCFVQHAADAVSHALNTDSDAAAWHGTSALDRHWRRKFPCLVSLRFREVGLYLYRFLAVSLASRVAE